MKFSLFRNDKAIAKDKLFLLGFIPVCLAAGIALLVAQPSFWGVGQAFSKGLGVVLVLTSVMFIPCLIYRLMTNRLKLWKDARPEEIYRCPAGGGGDNEEERAFRQT